MKRALPFLVVALLPFALYWKLFHPDPEERTIFRGDFLNQHYVWKSYALSRVKAGELPLWNPHILGGEAFHANPQAGIFYPPTYLLAPFHREGRVSYLALEAYQLLHQAFAGAGMLLLLSALGAGVPGSLLAAVAFCFGGFFTTPGHHAIVVTASWIPWSLFAVKRAFESRRPTISFPLLAIVLALMVLAGHPQVAYYGLLLTGAWALVCGGWKRAVLCFSPALLLALGLASIQLLPTYLLAQDSVRAELGYEYATSFGFSPYFLTAALSPRGQVRLPDQDGSAPLHFYAGIGTLLFAVVGLTLSKSRSRLFFGGAALLALLLSFGQDSPLYDYFYAALPGFGSFRVPYRLLGVWVLGAAVLAGLGLDAVERASRKEKLRLRSVAQGAFVVLVGIWLWAAFVHTSLLSRPGTLEPAEVERVVGAAHWAVLLAALNFLLLLLFLWRPKDRFVLPAFVALLVLDMAAFVKDRAQHPYRTLVRSEERPVQRYLRAQNYKVRYVTDSNLESYDMLFGTEFAGGHAALVDRRYAALLDAARTSANALSLLNVKFVVRSTPPTEYPWCGVRYASPLPLLDVPPELSPARFGVSPAIGARRLVFYWSPLARGGAATIEIEGTSYRLDGDEPLEIDLGEAAPFSGFRVVVDPGNAGIRLDDIEVDLNPIGLKSDFLDLEGIRVNLHALPRTYFMVPSAVPSEFSTLEKLSCWSVHEGVQVVDPESGEGASGFFRKEAATLVSYEPERIEVDTDSPREGFLVLADTFRPGWSADVDGAPAPILRAQTVLRAVRVSEGKHRVTFTYRPSSHRRGGLLSLASSLLLVSWMAVPWLWRRRKSRAASLDEPE